MLTLLVGAAASVPLGGDSGTRRAILASWIVIHAAHPRANIMRTAAGP